MIWRSQVLLSVKKGKKRRCLNWTKVGLKEELEELTAAPWHRLNWTKVGLKDVSEMVPRPFEEV